MTGFLKRVETFLEKVDDGVASTLREPGGDSPVDEKKVFAFLDIAASPEAAAVVPGTPPGVAASAEAEVARENRLMRVEVVRLSKDIAELSAEKARFRTLEQDVVASRELIGALRQAIDQAVAEKTALDEQLAKEKASHAETKRAAQEREQQLEGYVETYSASLASTNGQRAREIEELKSALATSHDEERRLRTEIERMSAASKAKAMASPEQQSPEPVAVTTATAAAAAAAAAAATQDVSQLPPEVAETMASLRKELSEAKVGLIEAERETAAAKAARDVLESKVMRAKADADRAAIEASDLRRESGRLRGENSQLRERAIEAEAHSDKLRKQLAAKSVLGAEHMQLETKVRSLSETLGITQRRLEDVIRENERLRAAAGVPADASVVSAGASGYVPPSPQHGVSPPPPPFTEHSESIEGLISDIQSLRFAEHALKPVARAVDSASDTVARALKRNAAARLGTVFYVSMIQIWWLFCVLRSLTS